MSVVVPSTSINTAFAFAGRSRHVFLIPHEFIITTEEGGIVTTVLQYGSLACSSCRDVRVVFFVISFVYVCLVFFVYWLTL